MTTLAEARAALARHKAQLLALPEATGIGIGAGAGSERHIVVYLKAATTAERPDEVDGVPVVYEVTGSIEPL
ncbi:MAG: hypothetical protein KC731_11825 [Myxococcales bacterium]|nr:hypothetical protein [Myxococcales bacterium]